MSDIPENKPLAPFDEILSKTLRRRQLLSWALGTPHSFEYSCDDLGLCLPDLSCCDHELFVDNAHWRWNQYQMRYPHPQLKHCLPETIKRLKVNAHR